MKLLLALVTAQALVAQQGATVTGTVLNSISQEPLNKVMVILRYAGGPPMAPSYATETHGGKFAVAHVRPGRYVVSLQRQGFTIPPNEAPKPFTIESGKDIDLALKLQPQAAIAGRVTDTDGDPVRGIVVAAMRYGYTNGHRTLSSGVSSSTDDHGDYRLFGLAPGRYYIRATYAQGNFDPGQRSAEAPTFFPSALDPSEASLVNAGAGGEARGIDIVLLKQGVYKVGGSLPMVEPAPPPPGTTQGFLVSAKRGMGGQYQLRLTPEEQQATAMNLNFPMAMTDENGLTKFQFLRVPPGAYTLTATRNVDGHTLYARESIRVGNSDIDGLNLSFVPAFEVSGKILFEGSPTGAFTNVRVRFGPVGAARGSVLPIALVKEDGTFSIHDVPPEIFELTVNGPGASYLKSIRMGDRVLAGREVDFTRGPGPVTIVLASDFGFVSGDVKDDKGAPVPNVRVTAVPAGKNLGRIDLWRFAFTNADGHFELEKVAPGEYKFFAWDNVEAGAPQDPEFRKPYENLGKQIQLDPKAHESVELTVVHVTEGK
jgi:protocatechuate 3,4-dioxygenase beta subunit